MMYTFIFQLTSIQANLSHLCETTRGYIDVQLSGTVVAFRTNPSMEKIPTDGNPKGRNLRFRYFKSF